VSQHRDVRRREAEAARIQQLRDLREPPFQERDRDPGLEDAWQRRLAGCELVGADGVMRLRANGTYTLDNEFGEWAVWSNVGRAALMLRPRGAERGYGYVVSREAGHRVGLNGEPYELRPAS
jgi:hypothetical protein